MLAIPALARLGEMLGGGPAAAGAVAPRRWSRRRRARSHRVIIVGYGRVGALVGEMLERHKIPYHRRRLDAGIASRASGARQADLFRRRDARRNSCAAAASTRRARWSSPWMRRAPTRRWCEPPASLRPDLTIVARARDADHAKRALRARRHRRGARDDRGEPAALRGGAGRHRRADGPRHRLDPREARRIPQDSGRRWRAGAAALDTRARDGREPAASRCSESVSASPTDGAADRRSGDRCFQSAASAGPMASAPRISRFRGSRRSQSG